MPLVHRRIISKAFLGWSIGTMCPASLTCTDETELSRKVINVNYHGDSHHSHSCLMGLNLGILIVSLFSLFVSLGSYANLFKVRDASKEVEMEMRGSHQGYVGDYEEFQILKQMLPLWILQEPLKEIFSTEIIAYLYKVDILVSCHQACFFAIHFKYSPRCLSILYLA